MTDIELQLQNQELDQKTRLDIFGEKYNPAQLEYSFTEQKVENVQLKINRAEKELQKQL